MIRVLFVCLGNICRSPIAEATFRQLVEEAGLSHVISCDSAATSNYHIGDLPDSRTRENARSHGLTLTHRGRQIQKKDFLDFTYIVAMDEANLTNIRAAAKQSTGSYPSDNQVFMLGKFDPLADSTTPPVPDPYYKENAAFEEVYQMVLRCNTVFLKYIATQHQFASLP